MLLVLAAALPVGALVGAVGIGGLLLPALLGQVTGDPHLAAGTSSWAFLFTAVVSLVGLVREGRLERRTAVPLCLGAVPGAAAGAVVAGHVPGTWLVLALAALCLGSGVHHLLGRSASGDRRLLTVPAMLGVAALVGAGSALTGTGGPVLLVPALLALRMEVRTALTLGIFSQVPIVPFAVLGYAAAGDVDYAWGSALGAVAAAGVLAGMAFARRTRPDRLQRLAACVLVVTGVYLAGVTLTGSTAPGDRPAERVEALTPGRWSTDR